MPSLGNRQEVKAEVYKIVVLGTYTFSNFDTGDRGSCKIVVQNSKAANAVGKAETRMTGGDSAAAAEDAQMYSLTSPEIHISRSCSTLTKATDYE